MKEQRPFLEQNEEEKNESVARFSILATRDEFNQHVTKTEPPPLDNIDILPMK